VVGATGVLVDMGMIHLLASPSLVGWNLSLSKAVAAEVALISNFVWNELWTFGDAAREEGLGWRRRLGRLARFNGICLAGIGWSVLLLNLQVHGLGWNLYAANFLAIFLVSLWNFLLNLRFGWGVGSR
jgi:dolichol-phosphate mannosyltransferase